MMQEDLLPHPLFICYLQASLYPCLCTHDQLHEVHGGCVLLDITIQGGK